MADNVLLHGDLAQLSNQARCNSCQHGDLRCVLAPTDDRCISCSSAKRDCIFTRTIQVSAPKSQISWGALLYHEPLGNIQLPMGVPIERLKDTLAPFNPHAPPNAIVLRRPSAREPVPIKAAPQSPALQYPNGAQVPIAAAPQPPQPPPPSQGTPLQQQPPPVPPYTPDSVVPQKRSRTLRSGVSMESLTGKGDACDDCRKHKRKCIPAHKKPTPVSPAKPSPALRSPGTHRFPCTYEDCGKDFTFMGDLQRHTREIHGVDLDGNAVVPHHCPVQDCTRNVRPFARRDNLRQHLEKRHGMSAEEADGALAKKTRAGRKSTGSS